LVQGVYYNMGHPKVYQLAEHFSLFRRRVSDKVIMLYKKQHLDLTVTLLCVVCVVLVVVVVVDVRVTVRRVRVDDADEERRSDSFL
jgi:hypothetical protein